MTSLGFSSNFLHSSIGLAYHVIEFAPLSASGHGHNANLVVPALLPKTLWPVSNSRIDYVIPCLEMRRPRWNKPRDFVTFATNPTRDVPLTSRFARLSTKNSVVPRDNSRYQDRVLHHSMLPYLIPLHARQGERCCSGILNVSITKRLIMLVHIVVLTCKRVSGSVAKFKVRSIRGS